MERVAEYKKQARECKTMAAKATVEEIRDKLIGLAKQWCELAREREAFLNQTAGNRTH